MRPRKGVNVASLVGNPEDEPSRPNLRLQVVGAVVLVLFGLLVLRLWTLQVIDAGCAGGCDPQPDPGRQRGRTPR